MARECMSVAKVSVVLGIWVFIVDLHGIASAHEPMEGPLRVKELCQRLDPGLARNPLLGNAVFGCHVVAT